MRAGSVPTSCAASSTVALDESNSMMSSPLPNCLRYSRTLLTPTCLHSVSAYASAEHKPADAGLTNRPVNSADGCEVQGVHLSGRADPVTAVRLSTRITVIGAGQAGLSAAYHLRRRGLVPIRDFIVLDANSEPGGAWLHRWPSLTLSTVNRIHDLPGLSFEEAAGSAGDEVQARTAVPRYFADYEELYDLQVQRPVRALSVTDNAGRLLIRTDRGEISSAGLINAIGTWANPNLPDYPGSASFRGRQLHTRDYRSAEEFRGQHVVVVGAGISAIQLLDEISQVTDTTWVSRREPDFREGPFDEAAGRRAVAQVDERVRQGLPPLSVVSVTGLPVTQRIEAMRGRGGREHRSA